MKWVVRLEPPYVLLTMVATKCPPPCTSKGCQTSPKGFHQMLCHAVPKTVHGQVNAHMNICGEHVTRRSWRKRHIFVLCLSGHALCISIWRFTFICKFCWLVWSVLSKSVTWFGPDPHQSIDRSSSFLQHVSCTGYMIGTTHHMPGVLIYRIPPSTHTYSAFLCRFPLRRLVTVYPASCAISMGSSPNVVLCNI